MIINRKDTIDIIYKYILEENIITYKRLKENFDNYVIGQYLNIENLAPSKIHSFYSIIDPLLSLGYVEIVYKNKNLLFIIPAYKTIKDKDDYYSLSDFQPIFLPCTESKNFIELKPLKLLKSLQSIETICNTLVDSSQLKYLFKYNPIDKKIAPFDSQTLNYEVGIYKLQLFSESNLVLKNGIHKKIQRKAKNYDELNYCFSYVDIYYKKKIFNYNLKTKELKLYSLTIPSLIIRALFMCNIHNFTVHPSDAINQRIFKNVNTETINELIRIFSHYNMEVTND